MSDNISSQEEHLNKRMEQRSRSKKKLETNTPTSNNYKWSAQF